MTVGQKSRKWMSTGDTVAASLVSGVLSGIESIGLDVSACLMSTAIDEAALLTPTSRVDFTSFAKLLSSIQDVANDAGVVVCIGRELAFSSFNALGYAAANGKTLFDALLLLPKYESLVMTQAHTEIVELEESVEVHWSMKGGQYLAMLEGLFFASWITLGKLLSGTDELIMAVHFTHQAPEDIDSWRETFGSNLLFNQNIAKVIYSKGSLALPIMQPDPFVHQVMTKEADDLVFAINDPCVAAKVTNWMIRQLPRGEPDQKMLAGHMNMSERTLRRYLHQENTSYQQILDNVREERATYYLIQTSLSILDISMLLGYQQLTAFNAAYKRWTGYTPGSTRKKYRTVLAPRA